MRAAVLAGLILTRLLSGHGGEIALVLESSAPRLAQGTRVAVERRQTNCIIARGYTQGLILYLLAAVVEKAVQEF